MKVIFLDFDGVINNWKNFEGVDFNNVKYLLQIIKSTGAKVVASSSKKHTFQIDSSVNIIDTTTTSANIILAKTELLLNTSDAFSAVAVS